MRCGQFTCVTKLCVGATKDDRLRYAFMPHRVHPPLQTVPCSHLVRTAMHLWASAQVTWIRFHPQCDSLEPALIGPSWRLRSANRIHGGARHCWRDLPSRASCRPEHQQLGRCECTLVVRQALGKLSEEDAVVRRRCVYWTAAVEGQLALSCASGRVTTILDSSVGNSRAIAQTPRTESSVITGRA